jgi:CRP/FNR family cyclic AMP-dependent transcriptional regulator
MKSIRLAKESEKAVLGKLGAVPLFSGLKDKQLKTILASSKKIDYPEGKTIVTEGEMGVAFYLILSGKVEVKRKGKVLAKLGNGNFFGEMSLLDNHPRSSDVVAVEPTSCLVLSAWTFQGKVKSDNELAFNLITALVHRLREADKALTD